MDEDAELQRAQEAANRNDYAAARVILRDVLIHNPTNADAWVALASVAETRVDSEMCLKQAAKLDPANEKIQTLLASIQQAPPFDTGTQSDAVQNPPAPAFLPDAVVNDDLFDKTEVSESVAQSGQSPNPLAAIPSPAQLNQVNSLSPDTTGSPDFSHSVRLDDTERSKPASKRGSRLETILLVILICVACVTLIALGAIFLPRLPFIASLIQGGPTQIEDEVTAQIYANISASNAEDINAYMAAIHSQSPLYDQTESMLTPMFSQYDLSFELTYLELIEQNENEARVAFVLVTRKIRGPEFRDNQVTGVMIMRREDGIWKIYNQQIDSIEYLK